VGLESAWNYFRTSSLRVLHLVLQVPRPKLDASKLCNPLRAIFFLVSTCTSQELACIICLNSLAVSYLLMASADLAYAMLEPLHNSVIIEMILNLMQWDTFWVYCSVPLLKPTSIQNEIPKSPILIIQFWDSFEGLSISNHRKSARLHNESIQ
jgi:hypothetical protein